jgi:hypothetical protein
VGVGYSFTIDPKSFWMLAPLGRFSPFIALIAIFTDDPLSPRPAFGVGHQLPWCFCIEGDIWFAVAVGVCNNPDSIPSVVGVDGTSWKYKRPAGVAFPFQVR